MVACLNEDDRIFDCTERDGCLALCFDSAWTAGKAVVSSSAGLGGLSSWALGASSVFELSAVVASSPSLDSSGTVSSFFAVVPAFFAFFFSCSTCVEHQYAIPPITLPCCQFVLQTVVAW